MRKVLGASVRSILSLLSREFVRLLILATIITLPLITLGLSYWLEQYAFKIDLTFGLLGIPVFFVFFLALSTVILKSLSVANANPVESLRYE